MEFIHAAPSALRLGIVYVSGVDPEQMSDLLEVRIEERLRELEGGLSADEDSFRASVRNIFRNGSYKPTGRAKPASEYLLLSAAEGRFPRINALVDCCNFLSISSLLPISIWDVDLAQSNSFIFRLGEPDEEYVFNAADQRIRLKDLIVGCFQNDDGSSTPIVNAVKDSMATKTRAATCNVAAAIYSPRHEGPVRDLEGVCKEFVRILTSTSPRARGSFSVLETSGRVLF